MWDERPFLTVQEVLARKGRMFCYEMGKAILLKFKTSDVAIQQEVHKLEVHNYGPYCLEQGMFNEPSLGLLGKYGRHKIDTDDLRLAQSSKPTQNEIVDIESRIRIVVYLVLIAPPGSLLRDHFPELDSCKISGTTDKSTAIGSIVVFIESLQMMALGFYNLPLGCNSKSSTKMTRPGCSR